jgi:hypothetical protein
MLTCVGHKLRLPVRLFRPALPSTALVDGSSTRKGLSKAWRPGCPRKTALRIHQGSREGSPYASTSGLNKASKRRGGHRL